MEALHAPPLGGRHRSPVADSGAAVRHSPSAADTVYFAPADTALGAGRQAHPAAADTPTPPADLPRPTQTLSEAVFLVVVCVFVPRCDFYSTIIHDASSQFFRS